MLIPSVCLSVLKGTFLSRMYATPGQLVRPSVGWLVHNFFGATKHLDNWLCRSVGLSGNAHLAMFEMRAVFALMPLPNGARDF